MYVCMYRLAYRPIGLAYIEVSYCKDVGRYHVSNKLPIAVLRDGYARTLFGRAEVHLSANTKRCCSVSHYIDALPVESSEPLHIVDISLNNNNNNNNHTTICKAP